MREEIYKEGYDNLMIELGKHSKEDWQDLVDSFNTFYQSHINDLEFDIKCDYCGAEEKNIKRVPDKWIKCRIRIPKEKIKDSVIDVAHYMQGPTTCPHCSLQLKNIYGEY